MTTTLSIDRSSLSLSPLVIHGAKAEGPMWFRPGDLAAPDWAVRSSYAPDSDWVAGRQLLNSVMDQAALVLLVNIGPAADAATLGGYRSALEAAVGQFIYGVTLTIDGVAQVWSAERTAVQYGDLSSRVSPLFTDYAALTIPVNP